MLFERIYEPGLAQASYFIGCQASGEAIVIDPRRDIEVYLEYARSKNMKITKVAETHIHADYLSGAPELAAETGAELLLSDEGGPDWQYAIPHTGLKDGNLFKVGNLKFQVMHTPGHTPEHICFLLTDTPASPAPVMLFSGDFVFVGDVGRPDLLEEAAGIQGTREPGARQMFHSLKRFKELPEYIQVWPGHGAGSACGKALGAVPGSTVGYEKMSNWALRIDDEERFVKALLEGQPEPPRYFAMMKKLNKIERKLLPALPQPEKISVNELAGLLDENYQIVDTRTRQAFSRGHIPGTLNIENNKAFSNWSGWLLDYDRPIILLTPAGALREVTAKLVRVGLDNIVGWFDDFTGWHEEGHIWETAKAVNVHTLKEQLESGAVQLVDIRGRSEVEAGYIEGARHIHLGHLPQRLDELDKSKPTVLYCASGARSAIGGSLLMQHGFKYATNLEGGIEAWQRAGYDVIKAYPEKASA